MGVYRHICSRCAYKVFKKRRNNISFPNSIISRYYALTPTVKPQEPLNDIQLLECAIDKRQPLESLSLLHQVEGPIGQNLSQKLAILLAKESKQGKKRFASQAYKTLLAVYKLPQLVPDDYTRLSSVYVVDACLRHNLVKEATEIYSEACNKGVYLDLPAYNTLILALVKRKKVEKAIEILKEILEVNEILPTEATFTPILLSLMEEHKYSMITELLGLGREHGVLFTYEETYERIIEMSDENDNLDSIELEILMEYINMVIEEDGIGIEDLHHVFERVVDYSEDEDDSSDDEIGPGRTN